MAPGYPRLRLGAAILCIVLPVTSVSAEPPVATSLRRLGVRSPAQIVRDKDGIPHIFAASETDLVYLQGYAHARDRLFQMDVFRRQAEGTLSEILGPGALPSDAQLRTFGLRRAAERSLPLLSAETRAALAAYAAGVNAFIDAGPLPPEYAGLEITRVRPWTEVDSLAALKLLTFQLSFETGDINQTLTLERYRAAGAQQGFDGAALFLQDTNRIAPFDPAATIPDALRKEPRPSHARAGRRRLLDRRPLDLPTQRLARAFLEQLEDAPYAADAIRSGRNEEKGSNAFVVSGRLSLTGKPLLAGDPHLQLTTPSTLYTIHLQAPSAGIDVIGVSFPGTPYVVIGHGDHIAWTETTHQLDVTDIYREKVVRDPGSPSGLSTVYNGALEPIVRVEQTFRANTVGDGLPDNLAEVPPGNGIPAAVLVVPRRNQGPILQLDEANGVALSAQYAGFSGTREIETFRGFARARNLDDFARALRSFDVGSQNFLYADVDGNIAYFLSGEVPLREDLQAGKVTGLPPMFIRDGQGGNEWLAARTADPDRALPYEILPAAETPRLINPPRGFIVTSNNDPTGALLDNDAFNQLRPGGGILYFSANYNEGVRAGRITELLEEKLARGHRLTTRDLGEIQADTVMNDARTFTPEIVTAFVNGRKPGAHPALAQLAADPRVAEAVSRLSAWDQSTPTGIRQGFDADDRPGRLREPDADEIAHSVAATIYSVWRNEFLRQTIVATLTRLGLPNLTGLNRREVLVAARNLLDRFDENRGVGASGVDFLVVPGIDDATTRRDVIILRSLAGALDLLSGSAYAGAFKGSTNQDDYRWGILHRVMLDHPLGGPFSIPPAGGAFPAPLADLPGIPVDGGFLTVDLAGNQLLQDSPAAFVFRGGPSFRFIARARLFGRGFEAEASLPGGLSGVLGSPFYASLLETWLTNDTDPLRHRRLELLGHTHSVDIILPAGRN